MMPFTVTVPSSEISAASPPRHAEDAADVANAVDAEGYDIASLIRPAQTAGNEDISLAYGWIHIASKNGKDEQHEAGEDERSSCKEKHYSEDTSPDTASMSLREMSYHRLLHCPLQ